MVGCLARPNNGKAILNYEYLSSTTTRLCNAQPSSTTDHSSCHGGSKVFMCLFGTAKQINDTKHNEWCFYLSDPSGGVLGVWYPCPRAPLTHCQIRVDVFSGAIACLRLLSSVGFFVLAVLLEAPFNSRLLLRGGRCQKCPGTTAFHLLVGCMTYYVWVFRLSSWFNIK